ncbi:GNAT family N-acetyltransferase [Chengkuizengella marina]|uniref:GNAT family N-acetyltransferase n=1 Tax=Chengkuizengella marina TaxID=2507566 RepID=A0A6N9PZ62_9BACL|nr:GNAT family N-acetyltransferase [Chengkuizengella marina]NBI28092.1 GNAT family N-acetyltransferase [Chengkuizengella marina]
MIYELKPKDYVKMKPLLKGLPKNPVINGVIDRNNLGRIFVDHKYSPTTALIWAKMEIFNLIGDSENPIFNSQIEDFMIHSIKPEALAIGDDCLNLELYPFQTWNTNLKNIFKNQLMKGERVPFKFEKNRFSSMDVKAIPDGYRIFKIDPSVINLDKENVILNEIKKFWESIDTFYNTGFGYCVLKEDEVIGTCISAFVSNNEYEIGINTYKPEHRGKGLATAMASLFIEECLNKGGIPHWTTEHFRIDSIAIANKLGFKQLPNYPMYFLPFKDLV